MASINNFKYVGVFRLEASKYTFVIDTRNIIKTPAFTEKNARELLDEGKIEPWKEWPPTLTRKFAVKLLNRDSYVYLIAIDENAKISRNDAADFCYRSLQQGI